MTSEETMEKQILQYLQSHQQAGDTLEGIARWWLLRQQINESVVLVKQTLEHLKAKGTVSERYLPDGGTLYYFNEQGMQECLEEC